MSEDVVEQKPNRAWRRAWMKKALKKPKVKRKKEKKRSLKCRTLPKKMRKQHVL